MEKCVDMSDMLDMIWTKIGKKCPNRQFWGNPHPNLATLLKSGNLGALKSAICGSGRTMLCFVTHLTQFLYFGLV